MKGMSKVEQRIKSGDIVKHFKRESIPHDSSNMLEYLYEVLSVDGLDTVTGNRVVVYRALYGERTIFVRPFEEFMSLVDRVKYPTVQQKYRFEIV